MNTNDLGSETPTPNEVVNPETGLAPCPFCGSEDIHLQTVLCIRPKQIICFGCFAKSSTFDLESEAIEAWNHRVQGSGQQPEEKIITGLSTEAEADWMQYPVSPYADATIPTPQEQPSEETGRAFSELVDSWIKLNESWLTKNDIYTLGFLKRDVTQGAESALSSQPSVSLSKKEVHTIQDDFDHFVGYSNLGDLPKETIALLFKAFEAAWDHPSASPETAVQEKENL